MKTTGKAFVGSSTHHVRLAFPEHDPNQPCSAYLNTEQRFKDRLQQALDNEMVMTASDFLYRRTDLAVLSQPTTLQRRWLSSALPEHFAHAAMDVYIAD